MSVMVIAATTRAQSKREAVTKPLRVPDIEGHVGVDREQLIKLQQEDPRILALVDAGRTSRRGGKIVSCEKARSIVYRRYQDLGRNVDVKQVDGDVTRYYRSCDVCQRTVKKGTVPRVPLEKVDTPFKRVAIDLVGPINPPSEAGHRLILTLVDYATRFAEAVPLRKIDTESVAEALVDIYSRQGVPEEVLSDQETQFISDCMKEVCRLLGIKQKTTTPYHPMCNRLVEKFNATLKTCLRRLCSEQPRQWHRYINPLLFAYREVPQESTHFAPFELLYGKTARGPMHILRELWTKEIEEPDVKSSYEYVLNLRERLDDTLKIAREELEKAQGWQRHYYDRTTKRRKFSVGEKVLVLLPTDSNKLLMQWKGPFEIVATVGINDYRINMGGKEKTFHTWKAHVKTLSDLFKRLQEANFTVRPVKCLLGSRTVDFLGHSLGRVAIGLQDENVEKVRNAPRPNTKREVRAFLGLVGCYKEFVPNFAAVSAPLSDLVRKGQPNIVNWGDSQERAYNSLKVAVTSKPVFQLPDVNKRFVLRTDASNRGFGAALMQENEDVKLETL
ncbi:gypsy retrotransposon integrase-like protein 1 [Plakobranchus ocellatus]|uniref:Gypsy retrotransposon integrase-like protein 1 n=1 Tax=Plakobranchus ocellatus TaxID=259542 RepID=A0AAV3Z652_9GAST|nr:gypsy retrotransposon integrase-like protein 1 [Plakobranchus ocellatus]